MATGLSPPMAAPREGAEDSGEREFWRRDQARMAAAPNYFAWQARLTRPWLGRRVIEIGCGTGNFTGHLLERELVVACDREPEALAAVAARFPARSNLRLELADAESDDLLRLRRWRADGVVCLNVLEHLRDDAAALRRMAELIPAGAPIFLIVPAFASLYGRVDARLGHFRRYTRASLTAAAAAAGLRPRRIQYWNAPGFFAWWLNARLRRGEQSPAQIAAFDRALVPWWSRLEAMLRARMSPPLGQSLWAILEKGSGA